MKKSINLILIGIILISITLVLHYSIIVNNKHTSIYNAKNNYLAGNVTVSSDYKIDEEKLVIYNITIGTTVSEFISKITPDSTPTVLDNSNKPVSDSAIIKTGYKLRVDTKNYDLSVRGDVLSEGVLTKNGAKKIAKHIVDKNIFTENVFVFSADYDSNGPIQINDITKMLKDINNSSPTGKLTASFIVPDSSKATSSASSVSCNLYSDQSSCEITAPTLTAKSGYQIVGWNTNENATVSSLDANKTISINKDVTYYAIVGKKITVTFDKNTTYDNNIVEPGQVGYDYRKTNIAADSLEFYEKTCIDFDNTGCYIDDLPAIYSPGNETHGFTFTYDDYSTDGYSKILEHKFTDDTTVYARVYNDMIKNNFTVGEYIKVGNVTVEFEKGISSIDYSQYSGYLEFLYNNLPVLFDMKGKIIIYSKDTFNKIFSFLPGVSGFTRSLYLYPHVSIYNYSSEVTFYTIAHELSHAFDEIYGVYTRDYDGNKISDKSDLKELFQTYSAMPQRDRPMGDYAYMDIHEFWAEANASSYGKKNDDIGYYYMKQGIQEANAIFNDTSLELDNLVSKYLCIAKNGYNERTEKCS